MRLQLVARRVARRLPCEQMKNVKLTRGSGSLDLRLRSRQEDAQQRKEPSQSLHGSTAKYQVKTNNSPPEETNANAARIPPKKGGSRLTKFGKTFGVPPPRRSSSRREPERAEEEDARDEGRGGVHVRFFFFFFFSSAREPRLARTRIDSQVYTKSQMEMLPYKAGRENYERTKNTMQTTDARPPLFFLLGRNVHSNL